MGSSFKIFSWHQDFITPLANFVLEQKDPSQLILVFPHSRPAKFLQKEIADQRPGPIIMPRCLTVQELIALLEAELPEAGKLKATTIDSVFLLYKAVNDVFQADDFPRNKLNFPLASLELFMPWGIRLTSLMEDFFTSGITPQNILHLEGEVTPFANLLLSGLYDIYLRYVDLLAENELTTPAQNAALVAARCLGSMNEARPAFNFCRGKQIIMAGFHLLSGIEGPLLRYLWEVENAIVCLHTDPAILQSGQSQSDVHWAAREHLSWAHRWNAQLESYGPTSVEKAKNLPTNLKVYEGFDLHSQLLKLSEEVEGLDGEEGAAIVLPASDLLLPALHSLSTKNINISMGYPLARSTLANLLHSVMEMQETAVEIQSEEQAHAGTRYHWKVMLKLLHQPYLRMLGEDKKLPLREIFSELEAKILSGERYISLAELNAALGQVIYAKTPAQQLTLLPELASEYDQLILEAGNELLLRAFALLIGKWEKLSSLPDLCSLLMEICDFLINEGGELWQRFPLDGEYLFRLKHSVIPALSQSLLAEDENLDKASLFAVLNTVLEAERVPFEAYPLEGVQILGMLESRLLSFKNLFILDVTEDALPGLSADDPLLPDSLRKEIGLPTLFERERVMAHTFYRLILSSHNVFLFYQTGTGKVGLLDDKKSRSRFIEELLWEIEKDRKQIIKPGEPPLFAISLPLSSPQPAERIIPRTQSINQSVDAWIDRGISPSALDVYLKCPLRFFYEKIAEIQPRDETPEGDDPAAVGSLIHKVLEEFLTPYIGRRLERGFPDQGARLCLNSLFNQHLQASGLPQVLPHDSLFMLKEAGPKRLNDYLDNMPETEIISLERKFKFNFSIDGKQYLLHGQVDRTDRRENELIVLDYKTGRIYSPGAEFWSEDNPLWFRMEHWQEDDKSLLADLRDELKSLQLPVYLFAFSNDLTGHPNDAAFVSLSDKGTEFKLLHNQTPEKSEEAIKRQIPALLRFVLNHLQKSKEFSPQPGDHCRYCPYASICGQG